LDWDKEFEMKCRIGFGFEKPKFVHLWSTGGPAATAFQKLRLFSSCTLMKQILLQDFFKIRIS